MTEKLLRFSGSPLLPALAAICCLLPRCESDPSGPVASVVVQNYSTAWTVTGVYIRETDVESSWGINELVSDVGPGESRTVDFPPDTYDIRIESDHPYAPRELFAVPLEDDMFVLVRVTDGDLEAW